MSSILLFIFTVIVSLLTTIYGDTIDLCLTDEHIKQNFMNKDQYDYLKSFNWDIVYYPNGMFYYHNKVTNENSAVYPLLCDEDEGYYEM